MLSRKERAYLNGAMRPYGLWPLRPDHWNDPIFKAMHAAGYVTWHKTSNRVRAVSITEYGRQALSESK